MNEHWRCFYRKFLLKTVSKWLFRIKLLTLILFEVFCFNLDVPLARFSFLFPNFAFYRTFHFQNGVPCSHYGFVGSSCEHLLFDWRFYVHIGVLAFQKLRAVFWSTCDQFVFESAFLSNLISIFKMWLSNLCFCFQNQVGF